MVFIFYCYGVFDCDDGDYGDGDHDEFFILQLIVKRVAVKEQSLQDQLALSLQAS